MYDIWRYFTIEEREAAAGHDYISLFANSTTPCPGDEAGRCPLANALLCLPGVTPSQGRPNHFTVANRLREAARIAHDDDAVTAATESARLFIADWDYGFIDDLREAMGLPPKEAIDEA